MNCNYRQIKSNLFKGKVIKNAVINYLLCEYMYGRITISDAKQKNESREQCHFTD